MIRRDPYNASIVDRRDLHDGLFFLWVRPDHREYPPFQPGQFVSIGRVNPRAAEDGQPPLIKRTYSIGSSATLRDKLELFIVHVDDGEFTSWLLAQPRGARLWLSPKAAGKFTLEGFRAGKDLVLVSSGTGIAPYLSMYRTHRDDPPWRRIVIVNGARRAKDLGYRAEMETVAERDRNFIYVPTLSRETSAQWRGLRGRVDALMEPGTFKGITGVDLAPQDCHIFVCGNPAMVETLEKRFIALGFSWHRSRHPGNLHLEKYW